MADRERLDGKSEEYSVLSNLVDVRGRYVAQEIIQKILKSSSSEVTIIGKPGGGKTTITRQLVEIVMTGQRNMGVVSYDEVNASFEPRQPENYMNWDAATWEALSQELIKEKREIWKFLKPNGVVVLECPAVGSKINGEDVKRGVSAVKDRLEGIETKIVIAVIPDPGVIELTRMVRKDVAERGKSVKGMIGLKSYLLNVHRIDVGSSFDDSKESGEVIVAWFGKMAQEEHLRVIGNEVWKETENWKTRNIVNAHRWFSNNRTTIPFMMQLSTSTRVRIRSEAAYMDTMLEKWGVQAHERYVVFNPKNTGIIHYR